jgi:hypothetical protein
MKIWMINIVLAGLAAYLGVSAAREWTKGETVLVQAPAASQETQKTQAQRPPSTQPRTMPRQEAFKVVVEKNLFASEREEIKEEVKPPPPAQQAAPPKPEPEPAKFSFTLYGMIATKGVKKALIDSSEEQAAGKKPRPQEKKAKPSGPQWYEVGEGEDGWTLASVERDKVVIKVGKESQVVNLYDKEKPKQRAAAVAKSQGPTVVTVATQAAASAQPTIVGEKATGKESEAGTTEARSKEKAPSEEKRVVTTSTSRLGTGLSTRGTGESSLQRDSLGRSETSTRYPTSRLPPFLRQR